MNLDVIIFYIATFLYIISAPALLMKKGPLGRFGAHLLVSAWFAHLASIITRAVIFGYIPVISFYETIVFISFILSSTLIALRYVFKLEGIEKLIVAVILLSLSTAFMDRGFVPNSDTLLIWGLLIHVPLALSSYGFFFMSFIFGALYLFHRLKKKPHIGLYYDKTFRMMKIGLILLFFATVTGAIWAKISWGSFWGWDPKETATLMTLVFYLGSYALHRFIRGRKALNAAVAVACFFIVIFNYIIINFFINGLHSYV
jgi:ABC-type transport system involved in cytochrome c biogenesis permease subunit